LNDELNNDKKKLSSLKTEREKKMKENQKLKQQTGIFNKKSLKTDYASRKEEI
jgi:hypothetical protein